MISWQRLLDRQENTRRTAKSSLTPVSLRVFSEAIQLPAVPFRHKLFFLFESMISHRRGTARSSKYNIVSYVHEFVGARTMQIKAAVLSFLLCTNICKCMLTTCRHLLSYLKKGWAAVKSTAG